MATEYGKSIVLKYGFIWLSAVMVMWLLIFPVRSYAANLSGSVTSYASYYLEDKKDSGQIDIVKQVGNLSARSSSEDKFVEIQGWFQYDITVDKPGWYELVLTYDPSIDILNPWDNDVNEEHLFFHEYIIDGNIYLNPFPKTLTANTKKVSNIWLEAGKHTFRIQRWRWKSFHSIQKYEFKPVPAALAKNIRIDMDQDTPYGAHGGGHYLKKDETFNLYVHSAGQAAGTFDIEAVNKKTGQVEKTYNLNISASPKEVTQTVKISSTNPGVYYLRYKANGEYVDAAEGLLDEEFRILDSTPPDLIESLDEIYKTQIAEIDCVTTPPDYVGGADDTEFGAQQRVVDSPIGSYREIGDHGYIQDKKNPNYIAYKMPQLDENKTYVVEVDYPDDSERSFAVVIRQEGEQHATAGAVDTGREYKNSNTMQTFTFLLYPRLSKEPRIGIAATQTGLRGAISKIRVYEVGHLPTLAENSSGRMYGQFYEEPINFSFTFGGKDQSPDEMEKSAERWVQSVKYLGGNVIIPTVAVYQQALYPSRKFDLIHTSMHTPDYVKMLLIYAEKYGVSVIPDFHRMCNDMAWKFKYQENPKRNWAVDKDGNYIWNGKDDTYTLLNCAYPDNQEWLNAWMEEFLNRYKDFKSLKGISMRSMRWANPGLNNYQNLTIGYDDYNGQMFSKYLGISDPGTPAQRYEVFTSPQYKEKWIAWRCSVVNELYKKLVKTARAVRPDLEIYSFVDYTMARYSSTALDEAGIRDSLIDGFSWIYGAYQPGRKSTKESPDEAAEEWDLNNEYLFNRDYSFDLKSSRSFAPWAHYLEDGYSCMKAEDIGLPKKDVWISAHAIASGRYVLQKYAVPLAEMDVKLLINGGNGYYFDQPLTREFFQEYRQLPIPPFNLKNSIDDPIVVRDYQGDGYMFYVVNKTDFPRTCILDFGQQGVITQVSNGREFNTDNNKLALTLEPYQLMVFKTQGGQIKSVNMQ